MVSSARVLTFLLSALALTWVLVVISPQTYRPLMLLVGVWATFRVCPTKGRLGPAIDLVWVVLALFGLGWPLASGEAFLYRAASPTGGDLLAGLAAMVVVLEAARRTTGWVLPVSALGFIIYAIAGPWLGSIGLAGIAHRGYDLPRLVGNLYMTLEGLYGVPLDVAVTYIILFSIYGAVLEQSGAGKFFLDFAMRVSARGNPAKAAGRSVTLAGFLLGTVSGSGVATTVTLGSVAWPILRRVGYTPETAGAMLAASGIGALLAPPTLGAAAFIIAEYLRISYLQVLVMATIPVILYYVSILLMIEGEASVEVRACEGAQGPPLSAARPGSGAPAPSHPGTTAPSHPRTPARQYLHFSSLIVVAALMVFGFTPFRAVFYATLVAIALSFLQRADRLGPWRLGRALETGGRDLLPVLATTAVAGLIVGVVTLTGLGLKAAGVIVGAAGGSLVPTVLLAAIAVWFLGLAVPVTASYIISAVMVAPALIMVGVPAVAAHMFIFYYAVLSEVSPPTALAPFAAAAITGGRPIRTVMLTWKFALPAFLVPLAFTLHPSGMGLLLQAGPVDVLTSSLSALVGVAAGAMALSGWMLRRPTLAARALAGAGGTLLIYPTPLSDVAGLVLVAAALAIGRRRV
jgi:TRAP transporter 4TM/12TM fusion protein